MREGKLGWKGVVSAILFGACVAAAHHEWHNGRQIAEGFENLKGLQERSEHQGVMASLRDHPDTRVDPDQLEATSPIFVNESMLHLFMFGRLLESSWHFDGGRAYGKVQVSRRLDLKPAHVCQGSAEYRIVGHSLIYDPDTIEGCEGLFPDDGDLIVQWGDPLQIFAAAKHIRMFEALTIHLEG